MTKKERSFGILIHPTSFDSPFGIGDMGEEARNTLARLAEQHVKLWQILPLGPTGFGDSPYAARSTFAGNELLIDLRQIEGVDAQALEGFDARTGRVDYNYVYKVKMNHLKKAATNWFAYHSKDNNYLSFCKENSWWLDDYALYQSLVIEFGDSRWFVWENGIKKRTASAVAMWTEKLKDSINVYKVLQYFFFTQWNSLHEYANYLGIRIIGDIPIFCAADSVDVWTNQHLFKIDAKGNQKACAGVPPDAFSATGQLWGNPVYNWPVHAKDDYAWYRKRVEMTLKMVDIVRIDHFRGIAAYWEIPAGSQDATTGKWVKGPGMELVKHFKGMDIIAEDLGVITEDVEKLLSDSGFPGMKVLQFAFENRNGYPDSSNFYLPFNYNYNCVAYTGTHDNNTTRGWYNSLSDSYKDMLRRYFQCSDDEITWQMTRSLISSTAKYAIIPMQDLLDLGEDARMNAPSTVGSANWSWRMNSSDLAQWRLDRLGEFISLYGRS